MTQYGTCTKKLCLFAHSFEQLCVTPCLYDDRCMYTKCRFIHSHENIYQYFVRTGLPIPALPSSTTLHIDINTDSKLYNSIITNGLEEGKHTFIFR